MKINIDPIREIVESLMVDTIRVTRLIPTSESVWDEESGTYLSAQPNLVYEGKAQVWSLRQGSYGLIEGGVQQERVDYMFEIPQQTNLVLVEDFVQVLTVNPQGNQQLTQLRFNVMSADLYTYSVSQIFRGRALVDDPL